MHNQKGLKQIKGQVLYIYILDSLLSHHLTCPTHPMPNVSQLVSNIIIIITIALQITTSHLPSLLQGIPATLVFTEFLLWDTSLNFEPHTINSVENQEQAKGWNQEMLTLFIEGGNSSLLYRG